MERAMPAKSEKYPWPSHYGHFRFFEDRMRTHHAVASLDSLSGGFYGLTLKDGRVLRTFICECYSFGVAEYIEMVEKCGPVNLIVINSAWCGYTYEAKLYCKEQRIGLFKVGDLMAALRRYDFWDYLNEQERESLAKG